MGRALAFLARTRNPGRVDWTDLLAYAYLVLGVLLILAPVVWLFVSSFKSQRALIESDPRFLPYEQVTAVLPGSTRPVNLVEWTAPDGTTRILAQLRLSGANVVLAATRGRTRPCARASKTTSSPRSAAERREHSVSASILETPYSSRSSRP